MTRNSKQGAKCVAPVAQNLWKHPIRASLAAYERYGSADATDELLRRHGNPYELCAYGPWKMGLTNGMFVVDGVGYVVTLRFNVMTA